MKIGYVQTLPEFGQKEQNFKEVNRLLSGVSADLVVLPELFATGYTITSKDEARALSEKKNGETALFLEKISVLTGAVIVGGFVEKDDDHIYNSAMMVYRGQLIGMYRKIHLFNKEKRWFSPGDRPPEVYTVNGWKIGMMICFDWIFPEISRALALKGAQIIAHPSNLVMPHCQKAMVTRCIENRVFAVTSNRIGEEKRGEDHFRFTGGSQVTSCDGEILCSAPERETHAGFVIIDQVLSENKMINAYNDVLLDRRPELY